MENLIEVSVEKLKIAEDELAVLGRLSKKDVELSELSSVIEVSLDKLKSALLQLSTAVHPLEKKNIETFRP